MTRFSIRERGQSKKKSIHTIKQKYTQHEVDRSDTSVGSGARYDGSKCDGRRDTEDRADDGKEEENDDHNADDNYEVDDLSSLEVKSERFSFRAIPRLVVSRPKQKFESESDSEYECEHEHEHESKQDDYHMHYNDDEQNGEDDESAKRNDAK